MNELYTVKIKLLNVLSLLYYIKKLRIL